MSEGTADVRRACTRLARIGLVARPYEPLADSRTGTHGPTKPVLCSRFRRQIKEQRERFHLASGTALERTGRTTCPKEPRESGRSTPSSKKRPSQPFAGT